MSIFVSSKALDLSDNNRVGKLEGKT
jgi:hypothetical protein